MTEYIDREEVLKIVRSVMCDTKISHKHRAINRNVKQIPVADVEPIVHCVDCCHCYDVLGYRICHYGIYGCTVQEDFYCKHGERENKNDK